VAGLADRKPATGKFAATGKDPLSKHSFEEKMAVVRETDKAVRKTKGIVSSTALWREFLDRKIIVSTDGARVDLQYCKPDFAVIAVAEGGGEKVRGAEACGVTGGWKELFRKGDHLEMAKAAVTQAQALAKAKHVKGERATVILDPSMVGLLSHEAVGHTVEGDFVLSGSVVKGKVGERVASDLVTLRDSGNPKEDPAAAGTIFADDEGTPCGAGTTVIEKGFLRSYLHDRETALSLGQPVTGNARAFEHTDEPIIRMTNTYILPGDWKDDEVVEDTKDGYLIKGAGGGQADANGEFMFMAQETYRVRKGVVGELFKSVTLSGQTFDLLKSVDAISRGFKFDLGSGFCGKFQAARVDGGGAFLRCQAILGGRQG